MMKLSEIERERIREEVRREFPDDEMMQEIHFVQQLHFYETKNLSPQEQIQYFRRSHPKHTA